VTAASIRAVVRSQERPSPLTVAAAVLAAAIAGLLIGGVFRGSPPRVAEPAKVSVAGVRMQLPSGWARERAGTLAGFDRALWLGNANQHAHAAVAVLPATSLAQWGEARETVRLRGAAVWRYRVPKAVVYVTPTTAGLATVACQGAAKVCDKLAAAVAVRGRLELGAQAAFLSGLPPVVAALRDERAKGQQALADATKPAAQGEAADDLAEAHTTAAKALRALSPPGDGLAEATIERLRATAGAYAALGEAARERVPAPYAEAGQDVAAAEVGLRDALTRVDTAFEDAIVGATATAAPAATADKAAVTPAATADKAAVTPAATADKAAVTPAATADKPAVTPAATEDKPAVTPAATADKPGSKADKPAATPDERSALPAVIATPAPTGNGSADLTLPLVLLFL
jgi:hypothetical protein